MLEEASQADQLCVQRVSREAAFPERERVSADVLAGQFAHVVDALAREPKEEGRERLRAGAQGRGRLPAQPQAFEERSPKRFQRVGEDHALTSVLFPLPL